MMGPPIKSGLNPNLTAKLGTGEKAGLGLPTDVNKDNAVLELFTYPI